MREIRKVFDGDEESMHDWLEENTADKYSAYHAEDYETLNDDGFGLWKEYDNQASDWEGFIEKGDTVIICEGIARVEEGTV